MRFARADPRATAKGTPGQPHTCLPHMAWFYCIPWAGPPILDIINGCLSAENYMVKTKFEEMLAADLMSKGVSVNVSK